MVRRLPHRRPPTGYLAYVGGVDAATSDATPAQRASGLKTVLKKVTDKGFHVVLDLEQHHWDEPALFLPIGQVLKAARPYWASVTRICIADEDPSLDYSDLTEKVRAKVEGLGLAPRPVGAVFSPAQILNGDARLWAPLDWVGLEAYTETPTEPHPALSVRRKLDAMAARIGEGPEFVVVAQSFTRNGALTNPSKILAVNQAAWEFAIEHLQVGAILGFRWGQSGGICDLPFLAEWWRERWEEPV
jgi:hypothetical protein